ncbi:MAG TPA: NYN domain-containing protein [Nanoarchaeota archaeon]|nr:MAG: hypothetical protein QT01_C0005G0036 [archaeon GW2011_AR6]MBS3082647.1 NYN domain-containing protein [Candidatus Pacearchaeota archaeon]HIH17414.1 NYN domain-containing protein [Nanoarchaeota archaeon]HIH34366.1 NYN domain-containing protein [Nanoarchaeota archaeon]HIH51892.1 NYN domain-containing protein [Nanoarchaeota archaeon]
MKLTKTLFYTGRYSSNLIRKLKWACNQKISELNILIKKQESLLNYISQQKLPHETRRRVNKEFGVIKKTFEDTKASYIKQIEKQKRNYGGQKELFTKIASNPFIEVKSTPLKQGDGKVYQKGVDVMLATDLVSFAYTGSYDVALILGGDTGLIECVKLVRRLGKIVVVAAFYSKGDPSLRTISDLMDAADYFLNLNDLTEKEIDAMSDLLES